MNIKKIPKSNGAAIFSNSGLGVRFTTKNDENLKSFIGQKRELDNWDIIKKLDLEYIFVGQNDKIRYYGNNEIDLCLRFEDDYDDDDETIWVIKLTDVYHYPILYEKTDSEINEEMIHSYAMALGLKKEIESFRTTGKRIDKNTFEDCKIDAYITLRDEGRLR